MVEVNLYMTLFLSVGQPSPVLARRQQVAAIPRVGDVIWTNDNPDHTDFWIVDRIEWGFKQSFVGGVGGLRETFAFVYVKPR